MTVKVKLMNGNVYDVDDADMIYINQEEFFYDPETSTFKNADNSKETDDVVSFWEEEE